MFEKRMGCGEPMASPCGAVIFRPLALRCVLFGDEGIDGLGGNRESDQVLGRLGEKRN